MQSSLPSGAKKDSLIREKTTEGVPKFESILDLGAFSPGVQILLLLWSQDVDRNTHGLELQRRYRFVNFGRNANTVFRKTGRIFRHVFRAQRLISEAHIHDTGRMSFCTS